MKKYEVGIYTETVDARDAREIKTFCTDTIGNGINRDAIKMWTFDTIEEAREEAAKHLPECWHESGKYEITECRIETVEVDEDGNFVSSEGCEAPYEYEFSEKKWGHGYITIEGVSEEKKVLVYAKDEAESAKIKEAIKERGWIEWESTDDIDDYAEWMDEDDVDVIMITDAAYVSDEAREALVEKAVEIVVA